MRMVLLLIYTIFFMSQVQATQSQEVTDGLYLGTVSQLVLLIAKEYGEKTNKKHLEHFENRWKNFTEMVEVARKKELYDADRRRDFENIFAFNGSVSLPLFIGLKFKLGETKDELLSNIASEYNIKERFCLKDKCMEVEEESRLWNKDFILDQYNVENNVQGSENINNNNQFSADWNYLGGLNLSTYDFKELDKAKQNIEYNETLLPEHFKHTPILLIPGVSPLTKQTYHSKILSMAYSYAAVKIFGIEEYKKLLLDKVNARVRRFNINILQQEMEKIDIVYAIAKKKLKDNEDIAIEKYYNDVSSCWNGIDIDNQRQINETLITENLNKEKALKTNWLAPLITVTAIVALTALSYKLIVSLKQHERVH